MPASPFSDSLLTTVVTRLRAAGCVFAEDEARLLLDAADTPTQLSDLVDRRVTGLPLEHVLGWVEFCGLRLAVEPGVFVPRRRTEFLVREAETLVRQTADQGAGSFRAVVVDLCCGCGALGAALAATLPGIEVHAADLDPVAVRCARRNLAPVGGQVYEGDLFDPLPAALRSRVDVLVANAPYVPTSAIDLMPPEAREYEPRTALDGGTDGLDLLRRVILGAPRWLTPGGRVVVETSSRQAPSLARAVTRVGMVPTVASADDLGATVVIARRPTAARAGHDL